MDFKVLFSQLVTLFSKLTKKQKIVIGATIAILVAFLIFLVIYTSGDSRKNSYAVLFESLSPEDSQKVIEQLEKDNIPYKIPKENTISIPRDMVYKERMSIASLGIPNNKGVGFELFDKQEFGATNFDQNVKFLRAVEGELSRTIESLAPIERATVTLALPKESLFVSKEIPPSASVMVQLIESRILSSKQIRGIKNLVAAAVPKLTMENVTLVNVEGEALGDDSEFAQMSELSSMQQHFKTKEEKRKEEKIITVLSPFIGGDNRVVAKVTIDYDFSQLSSTSESFDPENVVRSEQNTEEKREGFAPKEIGGVPGAVSNIGPVQGLESQQTTEKYEKTNTTTNYEISKTVSSTKAEFSRLKRITAAVVVDGKYKFKKDEAGEDTDELEYIPLDESQLDAIKSLVQQAIGVDDTRGDLVTVRNFQFESSAKSMQGAGGASKFVTFSETYLAPFSVLFKYLFVALILFIAYKKIISPFAERMLEFSKEEEELEKPSLNLDDDEEEDLVEKVQAMRKKVEDQLGVGDNFNEDELKYEVLLDKVKGIAEDSPEEVAALLCTLIEEESGGNGQDVQKAMQAIKDGA
jgi:flagellar M-ring protein FliF